MQAGGGCSTGGCSAGYSGGYQALPAQPAYSIQASGVAVMAREGVHAVSLPAPVQLEEDDQADGSEAEQE